MADNKFRLYWKDGKTEVITGTDIANAMNNTGYGRGALAALDFYGYGEEEGYRWDVEKRRWFAYTPV
jgi:hypothetical protein